VDDPFSKNYTVPGNSTNTLGETTHWFIYENTQGAYIDSVDWPGNKLCSTQTNDDCPSARRPSSKDKTFLFTE